MIHRLPNTAKQVIVISLVAAVLIIPAATGMAFDEINKTSFGVAIKGYDTVAYHTENRAVQGKSEFSYTWADAKWYFASAKSRDLFVADPERYAPQYGGY